MQMKQRQLRAERDGVGKMLPGSHRFRVSRPLAAVSIYGLIALLVTYPLLIRIDTVIVGDDSGDAYSYVWSMWRAKQVAFDRSRALGHIELINHPVGLNDPATLATVGLQAMTLSCSLLLSPAPVYGTLVLLTFILNGIAMYLVKVSRR
jgi:hypothetical protein